jgi:copper chaperone CopZ
MRVMPRLAVLLFLVVAWLPACSGSEAAAAAAEQPAPGHVASTLKLDAQPYCDSCVTRVTSAIDWLPGVSVVDVKVGDSNIKVWHDPSTVTDDKILEVLNKAGEKASLVP